MISPAFMATMGWSTVAWILEMRWLAMVHIPVVFAVLGLGVWLTGRARGVVKRG